MNVTKTNRIHSMTLALSFPLVLMLFAADAECAQASQKSSDELLLEIMDLHTDLVTNEIFLAQAKMLGAYLEAAQPLEESKKNKIYAKVLNILSKIMDSAIQIPAVFAEPESDVVERSVEKEGQKRKIVYEPGAAILEIFKIDADRKEIPELPVIRTYWRRDLSSLERICLLPERASEIGRDAFYVAKFSFYYEAKQPGKYGFTVLNKRNFSHTSSVFGGTVAASRLGIGGIDIVKWAADPVCQGLCNLKKGFHRVEYWFGDKVAYPAAYPRGFEVRVLAPGAFDAVPITKNMMLLRKE